MIDADRMCRAPDRKSTPSTLCRIESMRVHILFRSYCTHFCVFRLISCVLFFLPFSLLVLVHVRVVGGSIKTYQSYNSLATSMAISYDTSLHSESTIDRRPNNGQRSAAADASAYGDDDDGDDRKSVRSAEMTHL